MRSGVRPRVKRSKWNSGHVWPAGNNRGAERTGTHPPLKTPTTGFSHVCIVETLPPAVHFRHTRIRIQMQATEFIDPTGGIEAVAAPSACPETCSALDKKLAGQVTH